MGEQLARIFAPLRQFWNGLSAFAKRLLVAIAALVLIAALAVSIWLNAEEYVAIYTELPEYEQTEIKAQLNSMGISVRFDDAGRIMVPKNQAASVLMQLATEGYPKNGLTYWVVEENESVLTTDYSRKQAEYRQAQERIGAGIRTLAGVKDAIVNITPPSEKVTYLDEEYPPTASLIIHMRDGYSLTQNQIAGIRNLVSKSVLGLTAENIAIADGYGNDLIGASAFGGNSAGFEFKRQYESDVRQKVLTVLTGLYDYRDLRVAVSAVVNTSPSYVDRTTYTPSPEGDNRGVISYEADSSESYSSTEGDAGIPGTDTNAQVPQYPSGSYSGESSSSGSSSETEYDVSTERVQTVNNGDAIESVTVAVAVNKASFAPGEEARLINFVSAAANVPAENVAIYNDIFYSEEAPGEEPVT
ncbi:MAG: flagellar M-ring protein FliF, partial [Clostridiales Family XIII bacterium]|nr:flagellar M-ring protein FliF [Clostridiales Family XIII bacterium]